MDEQQGNGEQRSGSQENEAQRSEQPQEMRLENDAPDMNDAEKNKGIAIAAYFIFFLPILMAKESKFAMYHANQALLLLFLAIAVQIVGSLLMFVIIGALLLPLGMLFVLVLFIMGIMNAANGKMKPLPLIGELAVILK